jgi:formylglycine-generating enzyme required for sulfatase activity
LVPDSKLPPVTGTSANSLRQRTIRENVVETNYEYFWKGERRKTRQIALDLGGGEKLEMVRISKGSFQMGTATEEVKALADVFEIKEAAFAVESPQHNVTITRDFYLGKTHVTVGQFRRFVAATGYKTEAEEGNGTYGYDEQGNLAMHKEYNLKNPGFPQTDRHPLECVSWNDAKKFLDWLQSEYSVAATFPTEA